jgi:hypothetical protein
VTPRKVPTFNEIYTGSTKSHQAVPYPETGDVLKVRKGHVDDARAAGKSVGWVHLKSAGCNTHAQKPNFG